MSKSLICTAGACVAGVLFLLAAFQLPSQSLKDSGFDVDLGLAVFAFATAIFWAPA